MEEITRKGRTRAGETEPDLDWCLMVFLRRPSSHPQGLFRCPEIKSGGSVGVLISGAAVTGVVGYGEKGTSFSYTAVLRGPVSAVG